jgi:predicted GH43/DUF377 family glycosyl hydrolase
MTSTTDRPTDVPYTLTRVGVVMAVDPSDPLEREGVLNPGTARGPDGALYLFPRVVAEGNVSRIARARVLVEGGVPAGVRREGVVLAPDEAWERGLGHGGVEDPRITWVGALGRYLMTYVAFGPVGPRPALATSSDGLAWTRLGPLQFGYEPGLRTDLNLFPNKDVVFFPEAVPGPDGRPCYAVLHRPMWDLSYVRWPEEASAPRTSSDPRPSIWISYVDADEAGRDLRALTRPYGHRELAAPRYAWEESKIGAGPAPVRVPEGWLLIHHGVTGEIEGDGFAPQKAVRYCAGAMLLDAADPSRVLARTPEPLLSPSTPEETAGTVSNVVFPTAVEEVDGVRYVFYGMADSAIGVARLDRRAPAVGA